MRDDERLELREIIHHLSAQVEELERELGRARERNAALEARLDASERLNRLSARLLAEAELVVDRERHRLDRHLHLLGALRALVERGEWRTRPQEFARRLLRTTAAAWGAERASLLLIDSSSGRGRLQIAAALGLPRSLETAGGRPPLISGTVAWEQRPLVVRDRDAAPGLPLLDDPACKGSAFVSLPLVSRARTVGVLNLTNFRGGEVDPAWVPELEQVAWVLALVVRTTRLPRRLFGRRGSEENGGRAARHG